MGILSIGLLALWLSGAPLQEVPEGLLEKIREANAPGTTLVADWSEVKRSSLLAEDLKCSGKVYLKEPSWIRWETTAPFQKVSILSGASEPRGRFRIPTEKDFEVSLLESEVYSVSLKPLRRDLRQMLEQIVLTVDKGTLILQKVTLITPSGDVSEITFTDVRKDISLDETLFIQP